MLRRLMLLATVALITAAMMVAGSLPVFAAPGKNRASGEEVGEDSACTVGDSAYPTIQSAVDDASCDAISVPEGTYNENVTIERDVTITGAGAFYTYVSGASNEGSSVFTISSGSTVTLKSLSVVSGIAPQGGGINNAGTLTLVGSIVYGNQAGLAGEESGRGGGIYNSGTLTLDNSSVSNNEAGLYGGGIYNAGTLTLTGGGLNGTVVYQNVAQLDGGGIYNDGTVYDCNSTVIFNYVSPDTTNNFAGDPPQGCPTTPPGGSESKGKGERYLVNHQGKTLCLPEAALKGHMKHAGERISKEPGCSRTEQRDQPRG